MTKTRGCMISLLLSVVATAVANNAIGVMLSEIVRDYALVSSQEGLMSSCISTGALAALLAGIFLRGRISKVQFIVGGGLLMSVMLFGKSLPLPFAVFLITCFAMGIGMGIIDACQSSFLTDLDPEHATKNLGMLHGIFGLGGFLLPLVMRSLLRTTGWRMAYRIISIVCLLLVLQFMLVTNAVKKDIPVIGKLENSQSFSQIGRFLSDPRFLLLLAAMILAAMAQNGIIVWVIRYVQTVLGNAALAPLCLSLFWVSSTISRVFVPYLPMRPIRFLAAGSFVCACAWILGVCSASAAVMLIVCFAAGLSSGCGMPVLIGEGAKISLENTGLITNMLMMIKTIGQILMPLIVSAVIAAAGFRSAMLLTGIVFAVDGVVIALLCTDADPG